MMYVLMLVISLVLVDNVYAGMFFCGDQTKVTWYRQSASPSRLPTCPEPFAISEVKDEAVAIAQNTLVSAVGLKYLKVSGVAPNGLMVEVTAEERAAIDVPKQVKDAATAVANDEIRTNEVCSNNTLSQISSYWKGAGGKSEQLQATVATLDTAIAAVANGTAKTALTAARNAMVAHMNMFIDNEERQWRYICARAFVRP